MSATPPAGAIWTALSLVAFVGALLVTLPTIGFVEGALSLDHGIALAAWPILWGTVAIGGVVVAGNLVFAIGPRIRAIGLAFAACGIALAAVTQVLLYDWSIARYGVMESEYLGWATGLFAVLVGLATATFGVLIAPRRAVEWPAGAVLLGAILTLVIGVSNIPGLADGIEPASVPLGLAIAASAVYAGACAWVAIRSQLAGRRTER